MDGNLSRQVLLGVLGYLIERADRATIRLTTQMEKSQVRLSLKVDPPTSICSTSQEEAGERLAAFEEMAALSGVQISPIRIGESTIGFEMHLPINSRHTVLVVDDNEDVLELFQRYLSSNEYRVVTAKTSQDAVTLARRLQPHAITLDLMMPGQDGWDLMQVLLNQPETRHIPIIVCSVLKQKELALSMGATAFLQKPVTEQEMLSVLEALEEA
jgi:CheY-like chemotaxis protein